MRRLVPVLLVSALLAGCVTSPPPSAPVRSMPTTASADVAIRETLALLMEQGYVITSADGNLRRIDASLARWPIYRVEVRVSESATGADIALQGFRGGQRLSADVVEPLFIELQHRLGPAS